MDQIAKLYTDFQSSLASLPIGRIVLGIIIVVLFLLLRRFIDSVIIERVQKWFHQTNIDYDEKLLDAIRKPINGFIIITGFYLGLKVINFRQIVQGVDFNSSLDHAFKVAVAVILVWAFYRMADLASYFFSQKISKSDETMKKQFMPLITKSLRVFIITLGALLIIQNLGYSIGSLIAGLGIGGLAVALAAQETLANFFSSIMLLTDMPFRVDDWVKFGEVEGVIDSIGFRTTRVRTFEKSLITVPNKIFMNTPIENYTMRDRRRIKLNLGVTYDSTPEQLENYIAGVRKIIKEHNEIHQDFNLVFFDEYNDCSLNILVYCFTTTIVWKEYLRIREELNLALYRLAPEVGVSYAYPSRTLYWGPGQQPTPK